MYEKAGLAPLSERQISRLLNHHPIRVKPGKHHVVHLSHEQLKKHHKAMKGGGGYQITFDPYQAANSQYLRQGVGAFKMEGQGSHRAKNFITGAGAWDNLGYNIANNLGRLAEAGTNRGVRAIDGSGVKRRGRPRKMHGGNVVDDFLSSVGNNAVPILTHFKPSYADAMLDANDSALRKAFGGRVHRKKMHGGSFLGDVGNALKPYAKQALKTYGPRILDQIPEALGDLGAAAATATGNPEFAPMAYMAGKELGKHGAHYGKHKIQGLGIPRHTRARPRKHGGSMSPGGYTIESAGGKIKKKRKSHKMHFAL